MSDPLQAYADSSYAEVDDEERPVNALEVLGDRTYAVVCHRGEPVSLMTANQVRAVPTTRMSEAPLPPLLIADADKALSDFLDSPAVTLLDLGVPAIVLVRGSHMVGVLSVTAVAEHLANGGYSTESEVMGAHGSDDDASLAGSPTAGQARVRCAAEGCGWENVLDFYDALHPPQCTNPDRPVHPLRIPAWG